ncbi:MAG: hypothetical protein JKX67_07315 [Colwellia sp.]|nr:hypothetical protein [Colwellia sp.]
MNKLKEFVETEFIKNSSCKEINDMFNELNDKFNKVKRERKFLLDAAATGVCSSQMIHNQVVANQSATIDALNNDDPAQGMKWIKNGLMGPGHLTNCIDAHETKVKAQDYFDEHELPFLPHKECIEKVEAWLIKKLDEL